MVSIKDIAWLAGLAEGECCLTLHRKLYPQIQLAMADEDVIRRAAALFGVATTYCYPPTLRGYKPVYRCYVNGTKAVGWMMTLYSFMGERRKSKIREILNFWRTRPKIDWHEMGLRSYATRCSNKLKT
jgi:hypothetical protein